MLRAFSKYIFNYLNMQDLENNIRNHSDDRLEKIQEIGSELIEQNIMGADIGEEVQRTTARWEQLQHQVHLHFAFHLKNK